MKKLVKILAATTVAVATLAFVSCADGFANADGSAYTPATPAADDEPAERTVGTVYNYILDYDSTNADFNAVWSNAPGVLQAKVRNLGTTEKPNKVTEYAFYGSSFHSATYVEYDTGLKITDNNTSIEVEVIQNGIKLTYKLFDATKDLIPAGTYNLKSYTTIVNGVSTAITSADTAAWALLDDDEKTATVAANGAITWNGDTVTQVEAADGGISVTVSADAVTVAMPVDEYTTYVYSFTKAAAASSGSGSGGSGSGGSGSGVTISIPAGTYNLTSVTMGDEPLEDLSDFDQTIVVTATSITWGDAVYDEQATITGFEERVEVSGNTITINESGMVMVYTKA